MDATPTHRGLARDWATTLYHEGPWYLWYGLAVLYASFAANAPYELTNGDIGEATTTLKLFGMAIPVLAALVAVVYWRYNSNVLQELWGDAKVAIAVILPAVLLAPVAAILTPTNLESASQARLLLGLLSHLSIHLSAPVMLWLIRHDWVSGRAEGTDPERPQGVSD